MVTAAGCTARRPGAYGAGLQGLIDSGQWEDRDDLGEAYLNWSAWRYEGGRMNGQGTGMVRPVADRAGLERRLATGGGGAAQPGQPGA